MRRSLTIAVLLGCLGILTAQEQRFRTQTNVVQVPVLVTGKDGRAVVDLTLGDFKVLDNGVTQSATMDDFISGLAPISLVIAIQSSGTSKVALAKIRQVGNMIQPLVMGTKGQAAVVTFDRDITWLQDFTRESGKISNAVKTLKVGRPEGARIFDTIAQASERLQRRPGRRMILLISESRDQGSETKFQEAMEAVEREGIEVFGAPYSSYGMTWISRPEDLPQSNDMNQMFFAQLARLGAANQMQALALATGGVDFPFLKEHGIEDVIQKLGVEVHSQYILSFPQRGDGARLHPIEVTVPHRPDLKVRSRRVYWAD
jgi:VWFA-related protein